MTRLLPAVLLTLVGAVGCSGTATPPPSSPSAPPETSLTVSVDPGSGGTSTVATLTCDPVGGDHPDPAAACRTLAQAGSDAFAPVPRDAMCGQIYGGPATATVVGTWQRRPIDASFSLVDSCQIKRWEGLVPVLPDPTSLSPTG